MHIGELIKKQEKPFFSVEFFPPKEKEKWNDFFQVVEKIKEQVKSLFDFKEINETTAGCVVTSHCGKNTLGVLFFYE